MICGIKYVCFAWGFKIIIIFEFGNLNRTLIHMLFIVVMPSKVCLKTTEMPSKLNAWLKDILLAFHPDKDHSS